MVRVPHVLQPATVVQTVPGVPPLAVRAGEGFESPAALPPAAPEARTSFPLSEPQTLLSSAPVPKVMLPSLAPSKFRKPCVKPRASRRKGAKASLCLEPASLLRPVPVIFTVPATTVKVVSLGSGCNVIQPVNAAVAQTAQTIPITTLLVNPTSFPCPLNQPLVASSIPPLIVSSSSVSLPVPSTPEDKAPVNVDIGCPVAEGKNAFQGLEPKLEPRELSPLCAPAFPKEEHSPGPPAADRVSQEERPENRACGWALGKAEGGRQALEPLPPGDLQEMVKMEPQDPGEGDSSGSSGQDTCEDIREERSVALDAGFPGEEPSGPSELRRQPALQQEEERRESARAASASQEPRDQGDSGDGSRGSPKTASSCADPEGVRGSPPGKSEDLASASGQARATPAGPEAGGEKDGPEDEEEEDFDDLTQDEEDEMSSASEESVLSVPELQVRAGHVLRCSWTGRCLLAALQCPPAIFVRL